MLKKNKISFVHRRGYSKENEDQWEVEIRVANFKIRDGNESQRMNT